MCTIAEYVASFVHVHACAVPHITAHACLPHMRPFSRFFQPLGDKTSDSYGPRFFYWSQQQKKKARDCFHSLTSVAHSITSEADLQELRRSDTDPWRLIAPPKLPTSFNRARLLDLNARNMRGPWRLIAPPKLPTSFNRARRLDLNARSMRGETILMQATRDGDLLLVRRLLERGADPLLRNPEGDTAADLARAMENQLPCDNPLAQAIASARCALEANI
eukprot:g18284.t1